MDRFVLLNANVFHRCDKKYLIMTDWIRKRRIFYHFGKAIECSFFNIREKRPPCYPRDAGAQCQCRASAALIAALSLQRRDTGTANLHQVDSTEGGFPMKYPLTKRCVGEPFQWK